MSEQDGSWDIFLLSAAISYAPPPSRSSYWDSELIQRWNGLVDGAAVAEASTAPEDACTTLNYSPVLLLATFVAERIRHRLPLEVVPGSGPEAASSATNCSTFRIGVALPEGPFLPVFTLAIHSLNMAAAGGWLDCMGVVLVPLESDGATERLGHILSDSKPDLILVGGSLEGMRAAMDGSDGNASIVDFTTVLDEALSSIGKCGDCSLLTERLWPAELRSTIVATPPSTIVATPPGVYDAAKLVVMGAIRLATSFADTTTIRQVNERDIMSHIVYTSGTTGRPKGCVSSLASLRHYIAAKNVAHEIDSTSRVLLASAVTFDPCFSDILATFAAGATLCVASRGSLYGGGMTGLLQQLKITHVLCTPTLWSTIEGDANSIKGHLKVVALGGEPIPRATIGRWARQRRKDCSSVNCAYNRGYPRLCATYGVTEACVYQTFGEVVLGDTSDNGQARRGNAVGFPLHGCNVHICRPHSAETNQGNAPGLEHIEGGPSMELTIGEVVLSGAQVDAMSSYLNQSDLTRLVFVQGDNAIKGGNFFYRTGDLGYIDAQSKQLYILGRIKGDGMVKINGIRLELSEVESSIVDGSEALSELVVDCMATLTFTESDENQRNKKQLVAYCILSEAAIDQLGLDPGRLSSGLILSQGPLLTVLRTRCDRRLRKGCTPSFFVMIDRLPLSPTGKRDRSALPPLSRCNIVMGSKDSKSLWSLGKVGATVANEICLILNLQPCQRQLVTEDATFFILGGDSLAATLVVRGLYARHHGMNNSRNLGGSTGTLEGYFAAKHLLTSSSLGDYVQLLDSNGAFGPTSEKALDTTDVAQEPNTANEDGKDPMYDSLIESITLGYTSIAIALLDLNADPNSQPNQGRLGKVGDRRQRRAMFKSNPLHLACLRGNAFLVQRLLSKGCKANCPDASGMFPIHLACSRLDNGEGQHEDLNRLECVKLLLDAGAPLTIKDANKCTILHSAARSGHTELLRYIIAQWKIAAETEGISFKTKNGRSAFDWRDRWSRTPVHWAVLNQRVPSLKILLDGGCSANPSKPNSGLKNSSVLVETPLEMCSRLYGNTETGNDIQLLLQSNLPQD